jgi:hypothetical protein
MLLVGWSLSARQFSNQKDRAETFDDNQNHRSDMVALSSSAAPRSEERSSHTARSSLEEHHAQQDATAQVHLGCTSATAELHRLEISKPYRLEKAMAPMAHLCSHFHADADGLPHAA